MLLLKSKSLNLNLIYKGIIVIHPKVINIATSKCSCTPTSPTINSTSKIISQCKIKKDRLFFPI